MRRWIEINPELLYSPQLAASQTPTITLENKRTDRRYLSYFLLKGKVMHCFKSLLAVLCCLVVLVPNVGAQTPGNQLNPPKLETGDRPFSWMTRPYRVPDIPP